MYLPSIHSPYKAVLSLHHCFPMQQLLQPPAQHRHHPKVSQANRIIAFFPPPLSISFDFAPPSHNTSNSIQSRNFWLLLSTFLFDASPPAALDLLPVEYAELLLG